MARARITINTTQYNTKGKCRNNLYIYSVHVHVHCIYMYMEVYRILIVSAKKEWKDAALVLHNQPTHTLYIIIYTMYMYTYMYMCTCCRYIHVRTCTCIYNNIVMANIQCSYIVH